MAILNLTKKKSREIDPGNVVSLMLADDDHRWINSNME